MGIEAHTALSALSDPVHLRNRQSARHQPNRSPTQITVVGTSDPRGPQHSIHDHRRPLLGEDLRSVRQRNDPEAGLELR